MQAYKQNDDIIEEYIKLMEHSHNKTLQSYMSSEKDIISHVKGSKKRTFIDLGSGYGRVLPLISSLGRNVIAIELSPKLFIELNKRSKELGNCEALLGDITNSSKLLDGKTAVNPVVLLLLNTLGIVQGIEGAYQKVLAEMKDIAQKRDGSVILSLFCQEGLKKFGLTVYASLKSMVGPVDMERTDFDRGLFVSKTGYISKWWTIKEREEIKSFFSPPDSVTLSSLERSSLLRFIFSDIEVNLLWKSSMFFDLFEYADLRNLVALRPSIPSGS